MILGELNALTDAGFTEALGAIYEHSPWVAARAAAGRPFATVDDLAQAMARIVADASRQEQRALVDAHPDLGSRLGLAEASIKEQAGLGLDRLSRTEFARFDTLNRAYRDRFGFPFIIAVGRHTRASILDAFERRLLNDPSTEERTALVEIDAIARLRLQCLCGSGPAAPSGA